MTKQELQTVLTERAKQSREQYLRWEEKYNRYANALDDLYTMSEEQFRDDYEYLIEELEGKETS